MATKKQLDENEIEAHVETFADKVEKVKPISEETMRAYVEQIQQKPTDADLTKFAIAALESLNWNAIEFSPDMAAKLCWSMAEAMARNRP